MFGLKLKAADAIIGGSIAALGNIAGGAIGANSAKDVNKQLLDFQKNRYQYGVADMKAAGLNPMLMTGGGSPPSAPSLSVPGQSTAQGVSNAFRAFNERQQLNASLDLNEEEVKNKKQMNKLIQAQTLKATSDAVVSQNTALGIAQKNQQGNLKTTFSSWLNNAVQGVLGEKLTKDLSSPEGVESLIKKYGTDFLKYLIPDNVSSAKSFDPNAHIKYKSGMKTDD